MRNFLIILAAFVGLTAFGATNEPSIQMLATTNGVVKLPTNITSIRIGGTVFTNLLGFGLAVSNNQLSIDTTQLPAGGGGGGSGTVTSVGASTTVSGLGFSGSPVTSSGTLSLTGTVAVASGGTGATDASGARTALSLVPGTNVQAWDADLDDLADGSLTGSKVGSGIDDDNVSFDDADSLWTATTIGAALEELNDSINAGVPNGSGAKLHWSQLLGVPAGFADGSDDGSGGGSGTMTGIAFVVPGPFSISPTSTTTTNTFTLSVSNQTANTFYAGPTSGGAAAPGFRAPVDDDIPNNITIDLATTATTANSGDSATAFFSSGTIEEARIDSTIARDSEVTAATAEATLESVLDLQDLQGAVTDAQVPNNITIDQATLALTGDSATSFFSTGEIEDSRLPSGLARDSEVAAAYQPLDADLTSMAAGTAVATAQTNAVSVGAPLLIVGTTNVASAIAAKAPLASPAFTTSATIGGTNVLDFAASHLTEAEASALYQRTNANLTSVANLTGGTSTNFLAGDGTFKQVTTNMVPGLNAILATIGGGSGEANTASNLGTPSSTIQGLYDSKSSVDLRFRSIEAGSGITLTSNANTVAIASTGGSWDGSPIPSGMVTNLYFDQLNGAPRYGIYRYDEFLDANTTVRGTHYNEFNTASGGSITGGSIPIYGGLLFRAGTSASGYAIALCNATTWTLGGFSNLVHETRVYIANLSDSTDSYTFQWGLGDSTSSTNNTDGVFFEHNANSAYWILKCVNSGSTTSNVTAVAVSVAQTVLGFRYTDSSTNVVFSINRTPVWTNSVNVPNGRELGFRCGAIRSAGTNQREITLDWLRTIGTLKAER